MKILVPVKRVADPDNANKVKVNAQGSAVDTSSLENKRNPFDEYAVEAALRLNENGATKTPSGETVVVTIGPEQAQTEALQQPLAMGADRGILVQANDDQFDALVVARALKAVADKEKPDLIVMGKQAVDGDTNATGQMLAEMLGWPMATFAMSIEMVDGGKAVKVGREVDMGVLTLKVSLPAVVTVDLRIISPHAIKNAVTPADFAYPDQVRYASLKGVMAAKKKPVEKLNLSDVGVDTTLSLKYTKFALPAGRSGKATFVSSAEELVKKLKEEAKVI